MYAVIRTGGKQYRVAEGDVVRIEKVPGEVEKYRSGKKQVFGFLVGQVMKAMKGKGNPALVNAALKAKLGD